MFAGGMILLALATLLLVRHIQPAAVMLEGRAVREFALRLRIEPAGDYIPYYSYATASDTMRAGENFTWTRFELDNEATPSLAFLMDGAAGQIAIRTLRVQTLFAARQWSASEIAALLKPYGRITNYQLQNGLLVVNARGKGATLRTVQDFSTQVAALAQADNAILIFWGIIALGLFTFSKILNPKRRHAAENPVRRTKTEPVMLILVILLFAWGCFRIFAVTAQTPLVGYANTGDFFRLLACYGLNADTTLDTFDPKIRAAPVPRFVFAGSPLKGACYLSSQTFLVDAALGAHQILQSDNAPPDFELRALGIVSAIALCGIVAALLLLYARVALPAALGLAAAFAFVLSDPFITLYANTFLTEFAAVLWLIPSVALAAYVLFARAWSPGIVFALALSILLLGTARLQNLALPFVLVVWLVLVGIAQRHSAARWKIVSGVVVLAVASILALQIQIAQNARPGYMRAVQMVTAADAYYGALLPAMRDPLDGLQLLGLPEKCAPYVGKTWYQMQPELNDCAVAARALPTTAFLQVAWRDPWMFARLALPVLDQTRPWILGEVGQIAGGNFAAVEIDLPSPTWSVSSIIHALSPPMYRALTAWLVLSAGISAVVLVYARFKPLSRRYVELAWVQWLLTAVYLYIVVTAVLGDGYLDLAKHTLLARPALLIGDAVGLVLTGLLVYSMIAARSEKWLRQ